MDAVVHDPFSCPTCGVPLDDLNGTTSGRCLACASGFYLMGHTEQSDVPNEGRA
jgi:hypothetical protein